jgi:hypothetical protein
MADETSRLGASIERMRDYYPAFSLSVSTVGTDQHAIWKGRVQPIRSRGGLEELLDDIHHERPYYVMPGGEVLHHPRCASSHEQHPWTNNLKRPFGVYEVEIKYSGGAQHPAAYVRDPPVPELKRWHMFGDGSICPYAPWLQIWKWQEHTVVDYLGHVLGWLIKWMVRDQAGVWIGPEINHDPTFLLRNIGRNNECWCGSGKKYKRCHRTHDENKSRGLN